MGHAQKPPTLTAADYLAWEAEQTQRHEFLDGVVIDLDTRSTDCYHKGTDVLWVLRPWCQSPLGHRASANIGRLSQ